MAQADESGQIQDGAPASEEGVSEFAALLDLDDAARAQLAFAEPEEEGTPDPDPEPEASDDDSDDEEGDEPEASDEEESEDEDDEAEEDDEPEPEGQQPTSALAWYREVLNKPQRYSEVPRRFRKEVDGALQLANDMVQRAQQGAIRSYTEQTQRTAALRELWEAGDKEAFDEKAAEDPASAALFYRQQLELAQNGQRERAASAPEAGIVAAATQQIARLNDHPEARARVLATAQERGWGSEGSATPETLAELTGLVERELAGTTRPDRGRERAAQTQKAAARRKSLPKPDVGSGGAVKGGIDPDKFLAMSEGDRARVAYG